MFSNAKIGIMIQFVTKTEKLLEPICRSLKDRYFNSSITLLDKKNQQCLGNF